MKQHTIDTTAWHYTFTQRFNSFPLGGYYAPRDLCSYRGKFIKAVLTMLLIYSMATIFGALPLTYSLTWLVHGIFTHFWSIYLMPEGVLVWWGVLIVVGIIAGGVYLMYMVEELINAKRYRDEAAGIVRQPSTVKLMYTSFRQKYCTPINFSADQDENVQS